MERGFADVSETGFRLTRLGERDAVVRALPSTLVRRLHRELADWLGERADDAVLAARQVQHLALAGETARAAQLLLERSAWHARAPLAWCRAARSVADSDSSPRVQIATATVERLAGQAASALGRLRRIAKKTEPIALAAVQLELGETKEAAAGLERARKAAKDDRTWVAATQLLARALTKQGRYAEAAAEADAALARSPESLARADLLETAGVARSFCGEAERARRDLEQAAALLGDDADPRRRVRSHGNRALVAYNAGDLRSALPDYRRALELAEQHGLSDQIATAALNLGTACHQSGQWAEALTSYERGLRVAVALGQDSTEGLLRFNLAKLQADLGLFERAERTAQECLDFAERTDSPMLAAAADSVRGEILTARGQLDQARAALGALQERTGAPRQRAGASRGGAAARGGGSGRG